MMDRKTFEQQFTKVINLFGAKFYTQDRVNLIYDTVKHLSSDDFIRVVRHFLADARQAPLVRDFQIVIQELGLKRERPTVIEGELSKAPGKQNWLYHVRDDIWADNDYVFIRGALPTFIIKQDHPSNPLVIEAMSVRAERIREILELMKKGEYPKYAVSRPKGVYGLSKVNFEPEPA